ncbi:hypothetical protein CEV34_1639 [Brucella pseudogrignonensis]|jgi:hypothetical protein|uniref:Uncharacterized protein n=1 Tax=Brucella pseudogrignonensis TaxID=419475 RepID=A0A256GK74_9HYPH|nr:hypothetical protein CEV34_1639 [Brucella pseudogrignonensis]
MRIANVARNWTARVFNPKISFRIDLIYSNVAVFAKRQIEAFLRQ